MSVSDFAHARWAASAYDWNPVTMEAYDTGTRGGGKRRKPGTSSCQAPGCTVDLSDAKPYFKRHCICTTHMKAPQVWIDGEKKRYCQQCGHFESLDLFIGANRSCKMSLDRRSAIAQASKQKGGGGRSARSRDQQVGREQSTGSDNTSGSSDKGSGSGAKDSAWGSPAELLCGEADKRAGMGDQLFNLGRDVDMAVDSTTTTTQQQQLQQGQAGNAPRLPGSLIAPSCTASTNDMPVLNLSINDASSNLHNHHLRNYRMQRNAANGHPNSGNHPELQNAPPLSSVGSIGLGGLNLNLPPPQQQPAASGGGGGGWSDADMSDIDAAGTAGLRFPAAAVTAPAPPAPLPMKTEPQSVPPSPQPSHSLWDQHTLPAAATAAARLPYGGAGAAPASGNLALAGPAPSGRLLARAGAAPQLFSAAPSSVLGSLGAAGGLPLPTIQDPGLEKQLQDIVDSARLEGQGWFGGAAAPPAPKLAPYSSSQPLPGSSSSMKAAMWYNAGAAGIAAAGGGGGVCGMDICGSDSANGHGTGGGGGGSSLMTCMQYMRQQPQPQPLQQQHHHHQQQYPYQCGAGAGDAGQAAALDLGLGLGGAGLGRGATRELLSYRPGEPDQLVRMALKLTSRAPDELEPSTIASLRKMLSVYDRLQSVQGYVRPGCTHLLVDAHRALETGPAPPASAAGGGAAAAAADTDAADASPANSAPGGGAAGALAAFGSGVASAGVGCLAAVSASTPGGSSTTGSWWCDESGSHRLLDGPSSLSGLSLSGLLLEAATSAAAGAAGLDPEAALRSPALMAALRDIATGNETALTLQLEDMTISVGQDGVPGEARRLTGLPTIIAASCAAVSAEGMAGEVTLYGSNLDRTGLTFWARMHGVCYPLQYRPCRSGGGGCVLVRLPPLVPGQMGLLQVEAVAPGGVAVGPSYPLLVLPSQAAVEEVHALAAAMGPASLRRFVADFGLVLGLGVLLSQPINGVTPVSPPGAAVPPLPHPAEAEANSGEPLATGAAATAADPAAAAADRSGTSGTWGSTDSATLSCGMSCAGPTIAITAARVVGGIDVDAVRASIEASLAAIRAEPAPRPPQTLVAAGSAAAGGVGSAAASSSSSSRRRGGVMSRGSSRHTSPPGSGAGAGAGAGGILGGAAADPTEAMTNADDEGVVDLLLSRGAVTSLLETSLALLQTLVDRRMYCCVSLLVSRLCELQERFPDRLHPGLAPPPPPPPAPGAFGLMHAAARVGDVGLLGCLLALEGLMGEHCSLNARGLNGVTPLHLMALLPQAPALLRSLQRMHPGVEQALLSSTADDGVTPLQLYHMRHMNMTGAGAGAGPHTYAVRAAGGAASAASVGRGAASAAAGGPIPPTTSSRAAPAPFGAAAASSEPASAAALAAAASPPASVPPDMVLAAAAVAAEMGCQSESWAAQAEAVAVGAQGYRGRAGAEAAAHRGAAVAAAAMAATLMDPSSHQQQQQQPYATAAGGPKGSLVQKNPPSWSSLPQLPSDAAAPAPAPAEAGGADGARPFYHPATARAGTVLGFQGEAWSAQGEMAAAPPRAPPAQVRGVAVSVRRIHPVGTVVAAMTEEERAAVLKAVDAMSAAAAAAVDDDNSSVCGGESWQGSSNSTYSYAACSSYGASHGSTRSAATAAMAATAATGDGDGYSLPPLPAEACYSSRPMGRSSPPRRQVAAGADTAVASGDVLPSMADPIDAAAPAAAAATAAAAYDVAAGAAAEEEDNVSGGAVGGAATATHGSAGTEGAAVLSAAEQLAPGTEPSLDAATTEHAAAPPRPHASVADAAAAAVMADPVAPVVADTSRGDVARSPRALPPLLAVPLLMLMLVACGTVGPAAQQRLWVVVGLGDVRRGPAHPLLLTAAACALAAALLLLAPRRPQQATVGR